MVDRFCNCNILRKYSGQGLTEMATADGSLPHGSGQLPSDTFGLGGRQGIHHLVMASSGKNRNAGSVQGRGG